jgi:hypothetical protein
MRFYWPIAKVDAEQRMVWGYASTEAKDDQGETVTREALAAALGDYMRFANIREMHLPSAVGVAKEAAVDDRGLYLGAKIVDDDAWRKVFEGVYKGFSIGGKVTARDPADRRLITGLTLTEISVVDRPANPEAVFDCWKLSAGPGPAAMPEGDAPPRAPGDADGARADRELRGAESQTLAPLPRLAQILTDIGWLCDFVAVLVAEHDVGRGERREHAGAADLAATAITTTLRKASEPDLAPLAAGLAKLAEAIMPRLDALQKRVEDIAATPLPPQTAMRGFGLSGITKREDGGGAATAPEDVVAALARMTDEERTLALIKAAHANPISPFRGPGDPANR